MSALLVSVRETKEPRKAGSSMIGVAHRPAYRLVTPLHSPLATVKGRLRGQSFLAAAGHGSKLDVAADPATLQIQSPATGVLNVDDGGIRRRPSLAGRADPGEWLLPESR